MRIQIACNIALLFCLAAPLANAQQRTDPNEGSLGSIEPRIPEPMIFDLVRPLGAQKGEIEINSLFELPLHGADRQLNWAPEIEVAFTDSLAIELEAPMENTSLAEYKMALQGTTGTYGNHKGIHGWQTIVRVDRKDHYVNADLLYLNGYKMNRTWSVLTMNGFRRETDGLDRGLAAVSNATLFYTQSKHVVYGLESNLKVGGPLPTSWLLMPQTHFRVVDDVNLQVGVGLEARQESGAHAVMGWRLIREF